MHELELTGLDGGNLLGFLAALGTLKVSSKAGTGAQAQIKWRGREPGVWSPVLEHSHISTPELLIDVLADRVCGESKHSAACNIGTDLTLKTEQFGSHLKCAADESTFQERETADFLTAFGSEAVGRGPGREQMAATEFRACAGNQHFLSFMKELAKSADAEHLRRSLFQIWRYSDGPPSMRWDPADYRPHALRGRDPSKDSIKTMRGANRLAVEALQFFPTVPTGRRLGTVGFSDRKGVTEITWPIWEKPLTPATISSLLESQEVQEANPTKMQRRGIVQVYRARRFTDGMLSNFTPARALL